MTDVDGSKANSTITVTIVDDVPTAHADSVSFTEEQAQAGGNVLDNDKFGADGAAGQAVTSVKHGEVEGTVGSALEGTYGKLTLNADGTYSYKLNSDVIVPNGQTRTEAFTYTIMDADGDTSTATLAITINGVDHGVVVTPSDPEAGPETLTVYESGLAGGSQTGQAGVPTTAEGSLSISAPDGVASIVIDNVTVFENGALTGNTVSTAEGTLTVTGFDAATSELKFTYTLNDNTTEHGDKTEWDTQVSHNLAVTVTDVDGSKANSTITVTIKDDAPTISTSDMSTSVIFGDLGDNLAKVDETISFTRDENGKVLTGTNVKTGWWNDTVHISATEVTYGGTDAWGNPFIVHENADSVSLAYSSYNGGGSQSYAPGYGNGAQSRPAPETDWGLTVNGGAGGDWEIQESGNTSEAVVIELDGYAYGITVNFGAFFSGGSNTGTGWDTKSEKALIAFYKDGQLVYSTVEEGTNSGKFTFNTGDIVLEGFDRVVISAVDNGEDSDFTIQGIDFITKRDDPIIVSEGSVMAESGADGFAAAYTDSSAKFDLAGMVEGPLSEDGTSGSITVLVDGVKQTVKLELSEGSSGESILTGTLQEPGEDGKLVDGEQLFTATLDKDGNWTMEQYEQFRVPGENGQYSNTFGLIFKTEDADGDIASTTVKVPLEVVEHTPGGDDRITITGGVGVAGTVAAGDTGGVTEGQFDAGSDIITAEKSTSSGIIYGDVMNTDSLRYTLVNSGIEAALIATLPDYGSGSEIFQWLEDNADSLADTEFEGWTHDDTMKYIMDHHEELGYETVIQTTEEGQTNFFLVDLDGHVRNMGGTMVENVATGSLTGRGDDTIIGSVAGDTIFGQEGNDTIHSGEGSDTLYGGSGNDSLYGDDGDDMLFGGDGDDQLFGGAGNDYLDGGAGQDTVYAGSGDDIVVYDKDDYLIDGGEGIDVLLVDNSELSLGDGSLRSLDDLLGSNNDLQKTDAGPIVNGFEVVITGDNIDKLGLTSLSDFGITIGHETMTLSDNWVVDKNTGTATGTFDDVTLTMQIDTSAMTQQSEAEVQQTVFILNNSQGA